ncbi:hypothetical protein BEH94_03945 [Candidatus Altiarchaeales archaeon WOR_SM1_SCG]|nr:hypothetical protein BEH94_03945 [Candidatus Altiarchaeales archaeon WOR_SM1_SCG]
MTTSICNAGMVEIPIMYRKKYGLYDNSEVIIEDDTLHNGILLRPVTKNLEDFTSKLSADEDKVLSKKTEIVVKNIMNE